MPISADLGEKLEAVVADLVETGRYASKSDVLREGVRLVQEREAGLLKLWSELDKGLESAATEPLIPVEDVLAEMMTRVAERRADDAA